MSARSFIEVDRFLLPDDMPALCDFFMARLYVADRLRERLRLTWRSAVAQHRHSSSTCADLAAIGTRITDASLPDSWHEPARLLAGVVASGALDLRSALDASGAPVSAIVLRDYDESRRARVIAFLFADAAREPWGVLKVRAPQAEGASLRQEHDALTEAREMLPDHLRDTVPQPLGFHAEDALEALLVSVVPGESAYLPMRNRLRPAGAVSDHFCAAADWLSRFHLATHGHGARENGWDRNVAGHGDFWPRNLLTRGCEATGMVDWEHFTASAPPHIDLFHFAVTYGAAYPWRRWRRVPLPDAFRRTFLRRNTVSRAVRRYLKKYCEITGNDPARLVELCDAYLRLRAEAASGDEAKEWLECAELLRAGRPVAFPSHAATRTD